MQRKSALKTCCRILLSAGILLLFSPAFSRAAPPPQNIPAKIYAFCPPEKPPADPFAAEPSFAETDPDFPPPPASGSGAEESEPERPEKSEAYLAGTEDFIRDMAEKHQFDAKELGCLFEQTDPNETSLKIVTPKAGPSKSKNWQAYRNRMVDPVRIAAGVDFWDEMEGYLDLAEQRYGVPAYIVAGIIGIESIYGRDTGHFRTLDAIATLAFEYPENARKSEERKAYFLKELENLLLLSQETGTHPLRWHGSYAGAIGYPQFMPGSIRQYAVDFDGDGKADLTASAADAVGSAANFLEKHGWKRDMPVIFPAFKREGCEIEEKFFQAGLEARFTAEELRNDACLDFEEEIPENILYGLVDLPNGEAGTEYLAGTENFFAVTKYNRSFFYAMSVIRLGEAVREARNQRE